MSRPYLSPRFWSWKDQAGNETPGVGLFRGRYLQAHLTPTECFALADTLTDYAETLEARQEPTK